MKKLFAILVLWPSLAFSQQLGAPVTGDGAIISGVTPVDCSTTQVLFALAGKVSCDSGFTYAGGGGVITVAATTPLKFLDVGISRYSPLVMAVGNGTVGDTSGFLYLNTLLAFGTVFTPLVGDVSSSGPYITPGASVLSMVGRTGPTTGLTISNTGLISLPAVSSDSGQTTTSSVCQDTTTHSLYFGSGTLGICKGTSSIRFKTNIQPLYAGLNELMQLSAITYYHRPGYGDTNRKLYGFTAEQINAVIPELSYLDSKGLPTSFDWGGLTPVMIRAIQELKKANDSLHDEFNTYKKNHP